MVEFERRKPLGLTVAMVFLGFIGILGSTAGVFGMLSLVGDGPFRMNGEVVSKGEFLRFAVPFYLLYVGGCLLAAAIAWSIHTAHPRSRPLLLAYGACFFGIVPLSIMFGVPAADVVSSSFFMLLLLVLGWMYLYRKDAVVRYYEAIRDDRDSEARRGAEV